MFSNTDTSIIGINMLILILDYEQFIKKNTPHESFKLYKFYQVK